MHFTSNDQEQLTRLATSFPRWVPINPVTGKGPPNWKTAMLVVLGLFPIVDLLDRREFIVSTWAVALSRRDKGIQPGVLRGTK